MKPHTKTTGVVNPELSSGPPASGREWTPVQDSPLPLYKQIADYLTGFIRSGVWPAGMRLPPQRELCRQLKVNRSTLVTALGQLTALGLIEGNRGGGTKVVISPDSTNPAPGRAGNWNDYVEEGTHYPNLPAVQAINRLEYEPGLIRLGTGEPAPELLPGAAMQAILAELAQKPLNLAYEEPLGSPRLRAAVSAHLAKLGIAAPPSSILITSGALQGLQLVALGLLPRGGAILLERPSYLYSIHAFQSAGVKLGGLPMDERGLLTGSIARETRRSQAAMLYSIPSFHNPTGILMDRERREALMAVTEALQLPVLEDGAYQELWLDSPPPPPLKALDHTGRVLHLGTLSKAASPGLRIGWVVGPEPVVRRLADIKMQSDYGASSLSQLVAARWLEGGYHEEHNGFLRRMLRERRDTMLAILQQHFTGLASWNRPAGGFYIWLSLHKPLPLRTLFRTAHKAGLLLNTGDLYDRSDNRHLRLSYAFATPEELAAGLPRLAQLIRSFKS
ncbi:GntR family transcriptional regulator [Paenibacillus albidus]|uniref:GntR family transcriptional regulator n=1 Tax=Paenibacillus albidus TaxID=2041023 RepID=A0A917CHW6_9BACL|nr:PLP-dependent aminotransferase family protein [Paenibacillus albidus]GGF87089.1 GntR family transcriptional regulator [Paenibacillus albidus]